MELLKLNREERLEVVEFGRRLLATLDLDPVYVAIGEAGLERDKVQRLLLAYWCFYHLGVAANLSEIEGAAFWEAASNYDKNRAPRGRERRHFRGAQSARAIAYLRQHFPRPEDAFAQLLERDATLTAELLAENYEPGTSVVVRFETLSKRIQQWPMFGPWIAFKAADMIERLRLGKVLFEPDNLEFYEEPRKGADLAEIQLQRLGMRGSGLRAVVEFLVEFYAEDGGWLAPPSLERAVGIQEVETILCKWKAHLGGHYPIGIDTRELLEALGGDQDWGPTAGVMYRALLTATAARADRPVPL